MPFVAGLIGFFAALEVDGEAFSWLEEELEDSEDSDAEDWLDEEEPEFVPAASVALEAGMEDEDEDGVALEAGGVGGVGVSDGGAGAVSLPGPLGPSLGGEGGAAFVPFPAVFGCAGGGGVPVPIGGFVASLLVAFAVFPAFEVNFVDVSFALLNVPVCLLAEAVALNPTAVAALAVALRLAVVFLVLSVNVFDLIVEVLFSFAAPTSVVFCAVEVPFNTLSVEFEDEVVMVVLLIIVVVPFIIPGIFVALAPCEIVTVDVTVLGGDETVEVTF